MYGIPYSSCEGRDKENMEKCQVLITYGYGQERDYDKTGFTKGKRKFEMEDGMNYKEFRDKYEWIEF